MTPPIADRIFAKSCVESVERHGQTLRTCVPFPFVRWTLIEERPLLGEGGEAGQSDGHEAKSDATTVACMK